MSILLLSISDEKDVRVGMLIGIFRKVPVSIRVR